MNQAAASAAADAKKAATTGDTIGTATNNDLILLVTQTKRVKQLAPI